MIGTQLYRTETAPRYYLGHSFALGYLVANIAVVLILWTLLNRENTRRDAQLATRNDLPLDVQKQARAASDSSDEERQNVASFQGDDDVRWRFMI